MTSATIEERLIDSPHREKFDTQRANVRQHPCVSCLVLFEPKSVVKINVDTWKVFKRQGGIDMDHPYIKLAVFRIRELGIPEIDAQGEGLDEEILREYSEQLHDSDAESNIGGDDSGDEQVSFYFFTGQCCSLVRYNVRFEQLPHNL